MIISSLPPHQRIKEFKFQYDNTLRRPWDLVDETHQKFKFQYDNTLRFLFQALIHSLMAFKFQYDNTLSSCHFSNCVIIKNI